jgi:hypothetical protein
MASGSEGLANLANDLQELLMFFKMQALTDGIKLTALPTPRR